MIIRKIIEKNPKDMLTLKKMFFEYEINNFNEKLNLDWPFINERIQRK
ncbi:MAG: hypothetical protein PHR25_05115 [Clostridia bacterium]|nr:hypothetical protein [Clostridia bacterium]MDD4376145.1 hypothetical protein [Clostridia bacterium]